MFFHVYVLQSMRDGLLYVGYSDDINRRLEEHNSGKVLATKNRRPFELIYFESFKNQQDATAQEKFYKTGWGRNHLKKILTNYWKENSGD